MNQDVINVLNALASLDTRKIPTDPVFRYHDADLAPTKETSLSQPIHGDPPVPLMRLQDEPEDSPLDEPENSSPPEIEHRPRVLRPADDLRGGAGVADPAGGGTVPTYMDEPDSDTDQSNDEYDGNNDADDQDSTEISPTPSPPPPDLVVQTSPDTVRLENVSPAIAAPPLRPTRTRRAPDRLNLLAHTQPSEVYSCYHITARRAMKEIKDIAEPAIMLELANITKMGVLRGRHLRELSPTQVKKIIPSQMNVTTKVDPASDGQGRIVTTKAKARLVAGGDRQDRSQYTRSDTTSPTCTITGLFAHIALAASEGEEVAVTDVTCAYLNAAMPKEDPNKLVFLRIDSFIAPMLVQADPTMAQYVTQTGTIIVELDRALYGCIESARLWFDELSSTLKEMGFIANDCDPCVMTRYNKGVRITVIIYVDDLLISSRLLTLILWVITTLEKKYGKLKVSSGKVHSYIGMVLDFTNPEYVSVNQTGMIEDIISSTRAAVEDYTSSTPPTPFRAFANRLKIVSSARPKTPAAPYLFNVSTDSPPLHDLLKVIFHSTVAKLMFISTRTRQDILTSLSFLAGRVLFPTEEDWGKLTRVLQYLGSTKGISLQLGCTLPVQVHTSIDSSFNPISSGKSRSGVCISLGRGVLYSKSTMQKINTTSSCQAELVALAKSLQQSIFLAFFLASHGYPQLPAIVSQDNQSTLRLIENGRPSSELTRHIEIGYFWAKDLIERKLIEVIYCPTEDMLADFFTKPLQSLLFDSLRGKIMGASLLYPLSNK